MVKFLAVLMMVYTFRNLLGLLESALQLNKANNTDTEAPILDLHLSIANEFVSSKIYDKRNDFDFDIHVINSPFLDGEVPRRASYGVCISQLIRFAEFAIMLRTSMREMNV